MKHILFFCVMSLPVALLPSAQFGSTYYAARSQSVDAARDLVGFCQFLNRANDSFEGSILITPGFQHSLQSPRIAGYFFNTNRLHITGSMAKDRQDNNWLADYFGLSPTFESTVYMDPIIKSALIDMDIYLCLANWYIRLHTPATWTRYHYALSECIDHNGSHQPYPSYYMSQAATTAPFCSFIDALGGHIRFGDQHEGMTKCLINGAHNKKGFADFRCLIGYHIKRNCYYYTGLSLIIAAPTGNKSSGTYFFEPIIGNGRHWELGIGFDGRALAWQTENNEHTLSLYGSIRTTHLFRSYQERTFDFCNNNFGSRYLLLKEFDEKGIYTGNLINASTITTLPCSSWIGAQCDLVAMLGYLGHGIELDIGYNAWIRTREHICITGTIPTRRYGIKGIQNVFTDYNQASNVTQNNATIEGNALTPAIQKETADPYSPIFVQVSDLDPNSGAARKAFTHKFFAHAGYTWHEYDNIHPYIGIYGSIEFEGMAPCQNRPANNNTVAQWGIWLKGGILLQ